MTTAENSNGSTERFEVPQDMVVYYLRLLKRGSRWTPESTALKP